MNKEATSYIEKQKSPQKEILKKLRRIILKTCAGIEERMYVGVPWYGNKFYLVGLKDSVNIGFSVKGLVKKDQELFMGKGKMMRHLKFREVKEIDEKEIVKRLKIVMKKSNEFH